MIKISILHVKSGKTMSKDYVVQASHRQVKLQVFWKFNIINSAACELYSFLKNQA